MFGFKKTGAEDIEHLKKYFENCNYKLCEYSAGIMYMMSSIAKCSFAEFNGCLMFSYEYKGDLFFSFPVCENISQAEMCLAFFDEYCMANEILPRFSFITDEMLPVLVSHYSNFSVSKPRNFKNYIYDAETFIKYSGRKLNGQRNHVNKFRRLYPNAYFRKLTENDDEKIADFWKEFEPQFKTNSKSAKAELKSAVEIMKLRSHFLSGAVFNDDKIIGIALGEICGKTLIIHVEKALYSFEGVYPALAHYFAEAFADNTFEINREDDAADFGLRTSKMQYCPKKLLSNNSFFVETELSKLKALPTLKSKRLKMCPLCRDDICEYNKLCLDDERNKYWGYDYKKDLKGDLLEDYFYNTANEDFNKGICASFAIKLNREFVGEVVVFHPDYKGTYEIGCRILKKYDGNRFGTEALECVANWVLYELSAEKVVSKCYKENVASYKMLSSIMKKCGEDECYFYFEKIM